MRATVTWCSCIASSSADWVFGVARLISSASTRLAKIGPGLELEDAAAALLDQDVRARDVGRHQVGRELDPVEGAVDDVAEGPDEHRLAEAGDALEEHVAVREQADERVANELLLADDDLADLGLDAPGAFGERLGREPDGAGLRCGGCVHGSSGWLGDARGVAHWRGSSELK